MAIIFCQLSNIHKIQHVANKLYECKLPWIKNMYLFNVSYICKSIALILLLPNPSNNFESHLLYATDITKRMKNITYPNPAAYCLLPYSITTPSFDMKAIIIKIFASSDQTQFTTYHNCHSPIFAIFMQQQPSWPSQIVIWQLSLAILLFIIWFPCIWPTQLPFCHGKTCNFLISLAS